MALINYTNQLKYTGKGYIDSKMQPFSTLDDLKALSKSEISSKYTPGMVAMVLDDGTDKNVQYVLTSAYTWEKLIDLSPIEEAIESYGESINDLVSQVANKADKTEVASLSSIVNQIAGGISGLTSDVQKLKSQIDEKASVSAVTSLEGQIQELDSRVEALEQTSGTTGGGSLVSVDNETIYFKTGTTISVKISEREDNALSKEDDGLFAHGVYMSLDDEDINNANL